MCSSTVLVKSEIEKKIIAAEEKQAFVKRAIKAGICPECGGTLDIDKKVDKDQPQEEYEYYTRYVRKVYTCQDCNFKMEFKL